MLADPSNEAEPLRSPPKAMVRAVDSASAVAAFPVVSELIVDARSTFTEPTDADNTIFPSEFPIESTPALESTLAVIVMFEVPSNDAEPERSPPREIVRAVCKAVAVAALPLVFALIEDGNPICTEPVEADTSTSLAVPVIAVTEPTGVNADPVYT